MSRREEFLAQIQRFLDATGMSPTAFGRDALGDPRFVFQVRDGRNPNTSLMDRAESFMRKYRGGKAA
jgi:homoserine dehydrogenase